MEIIQQQESIDATESQRLKFFRVLHPEFLKKLRLPFAFILKTGLKPGTATIRTQLGVWHVNLEPEAEGDGRSSMFFGAGWPEFSKDHNLHVGYFMLFEYKGNMVFHADIFNKTCCNMEYAGNLQNNGEETSKNSKRKAKGRKHVLQVPQSENMLEPGDARSDDAREHPAAVCPAIIPQFEKIMTTDRRMVIPYGFCSSTGLFNASEIILKDEENREWKVVLWTRPLKCRFGKGFRKFMEANGIKVGDKCVFQLVSERTLHVQIIRAQQPLPPARRRKLICHRFT